MVLPRQFLRMCRSSLRRPKIADSTGVEMTGGNLLMRTLILRRILRRTLGADERFVGMLLPPSAGGVLVNAAMAIDRRVAVNLNYTVSSEILNYCTQVCGIQHVLTSRRFMEKLELKLDAPLIYLEDLRPQASAVDKLVAATQTYAMPTAMLDSALGLKALKPSDLLTVIFTSGSTGKPKGVMLTQENIRSNVQAIDRVIHLTEDDVLCGTLPFFHSFGYTVTLWTALSLAPKAVYHFSPLDAKQVGKLCHEHRATIILSTPTFLRSYLRRCAKEEFASLEVVVAGAEKLPMDLAAAFGEKFGVRPVEGYGTTELSPLVSVNIPPSRATDGSSSGLREGTVGRCVPEVEAKTIHPETGEDLPRGEAGLLLIRGPNVMAGYLNEPELTAKAMRGDWYVTGDMAIVQPDGFIQITGRQSRFSKIGGEMVPHIRIEEVLQQIVSPEEQALCVAVSAVPDERRGERLVVLHTELAKPADQIVREMAQAGLPNLWIPSPDSFVQVQEIPVLGTGKLDLQRLKQLAAEHFPASVVKA
jgi:acyl-[acyl-carrier-protein]-phospholipid O-acyltransferase/long-chain-fatty-acid--[acyl-carrier-protein] ligase